MRLKANGLELEYDTFGDASRPPIVLIMGFGQQLIAWDERFCHELVSRGFFVVRFDNRDVGLSQKMENAPLPNFGAIMAGDLSTIPYSIDDMADDTAALIEALGFESAHVVGASMGGMIGQALALRHPNRVRSLASIMSTTGDRRVGNASPQAGAAVLAKPPPEREAFIEHGVRAWRTLSGSGAPFDEAQARERVARALDRSFYPAGTQRQAAVIFAAPDRTDRLRAVRVPVVVIHGQDDPLVNVSGGEATAKAIPGARLVVIPGMGHELPERCWPIILDAIIENARRAPP